MASASLGIKRHCQSCGKNFYDLNKDPITCPHCQTIFDPEVLLKSSRAKSMVQPSAKQETPKTAPAADDLETDIDDVDGNIEADEDMLDDDSDIAAIAPGEMTDDEEIEVTTGDDSIEDELDAPVLDDDE